MKSVIVLILVLVCPQIFAQEDLEENSWRRAYYYRQTLEVRSIFHNNDVQKRFNYCLENSNPDVLTCGSLVFFSSHQGFMYNFSSLERQVGATEYFIPNSNGTYRAYLDDLFDGQVFVDHVYQENSQLRVRFINSLPHIPQIRLKLHGTSKYGLVNFNFYSNRLEIDGYIYDEKDPDYRKAVMLKYNRVN